MGSVKDLNIIKEASAEYTGQGIFNFSDRYSVFDWGEMPDTIPKKSMAIALLGAYFFEEIEQMGIKTHYKGLLEDNTPKSLNGLKNPSTQMVVDLFRVVKPENNAGTYNYDVFKNLSGNFLVPLEIIYRNTLPEGSSVFKRLEKGEVSLQDLGLSSQPLTGEVLKTPLVDFSTKLEITDRYITPSQAQEIAGLDNDEIKAVYNLVLDINRIISTSFRRIGATNLDGKIEVAFNAERELTLVDVLGTLDECRFDYNGVHLSKEVTRVYYRKTDWYPETERAKEKDRQNWKNECRIQPGKLPAEFLELISFMYCEVTNQVTNRKWFRVPLSLKEIVDGIKTFIK
jgi:phosphoribosylaminoimidazole-succinocarboxamide synthase